MLSIDEAEVLDRLAVAAPPRAASPSSSGLRRAHLRGAGLEFHEYRHYQPGDDLRSIDWTVEARLRQLVVRVPRADGHLTLHVMLDVSGSMRTGAPAKLACAKKIAAALCYVSIERRELAGVATFTDRVGAVVPPAHGRTQLLRIFDVLDRQRASGRSGIDEALAAFGSVVRGPGLVVVLSDFFDAESDLRGLRVLLHRGLVPAVVQIVATDELQPVLAAGTELLDVEDPTAPPLMVDHEIVGAYQARLAGHTAALRDFCLRNGVPWLRIQSDQPFVDMLSAVEESGLLSAYA